MSYEDSTSNRLPHQISVLEIMKQMNISEQELLNCEFISAYNRLKKVQKLIHSLPKSEESDSIKNKYRTLNNELSIKIIKYISDTKKNM